METVEPIRSKKQIDNMKRYLKETSLRNWLLFTLGINSGLRIGDLLSIPGQVAPPVRLCDTAIPLERYHHSGK